MSINQIVSDDLAPVCDKETIMRGLSDFPDLVLKDPCLANGLYCPGTFMVRLLSFTKYAGYRLESAPAVFTPDSLVTYLNDCLIELEMGYKLIGIGETSQPIPPEYAPWQSMMPDQWTEIQTAYELIVDRVAPQPFAEAFLEMRNK